MCYIEESLPPSTLSVMLSFPGMLNGAYFKKNWLQSQLILVPVTPFWLITDSITASDKLPSS